MIIEQKFHDEYLFFFEAAVDQVQMTITSTDVSVTLEKAIKFIRMFTFNVGRSLAELYDLPLPDATIEMEQVRDKVYKVILTFGDEIKERKLVFDKSFKTPAQKLFEMIEKISGEEDY